MNDFKEISEIIKVVIKELKQQEYITLEEVLKITGLAEVTLRDHLRNKVTAIGRNAWDRKEFFDYWKKMHNEKQKISAVKTIQTKEVLKNIIDYHRRK